MNYARLGEALCYYKALGYQYLETPWIVPEWATEITMPPEGRALDVGGGETLVGSAEQSFLWLESEGWMKKGKYVTCTPCFRPTDNDGDLHRPYFMKVELYQTDEVNIDTLVNMIWDVRALFMQYMLGTGSILREIDLPGGRDLNGLTTYAPRDILINDIEVGSYGYRKFGLHRWVYGTGLAEPRFSRALADNSLGKNSQNTLKE